ncbi:hypothetical protein Pdw03_0527 [Penicillium digitatum]|uniref:Uncharacterized protein n=1 Tax=Penicillium digitatum TaxID=36651 RepID=A0A7T6XQM9_PENDI|nr:hypothetical protein Pdw03_0527 [Penicillium digitatum]
MELWVKLNEGPPPTTAIFLGHPASSPTSLLLLFLSPSDPPFDFFLTSLFFISLAFCILMPSRSLWTRIILSIFYFSPDALPVLAFGKHRVRVLSTLRSILIP